jgi:hypothetical protein
MWEVADIVRLHGAAYQQQYGNTLSSVQKRALRDIAACRTAFFGGHVYQCDHCQQHVFSYHSCRNRSCPKCHQDQTEHWLQRQSRRLLPCAYFLLTFTLPTHLRRLARSRPKKIYGLLMKAAADALQMLVRDPRYVGARIGALAVLHTWTRAMLFHPHVHMLVTAGGLSGDGASWVNSKNPRFLIPVRALSVIFQAKFCAALNKAGLLQFAPPAVWQKKWVVHSQQAGRGDKVLQYLARYVFRIAIANSAWNPSKMGRSAFATPTIDLIRFGMSHFPLSSSSIASSNTSCHAAPPKFAITASSAHPANSNSNAPDSGCLPIPHRVQPTRLLQ